MIMIDKIKFAKKIISLEAKALNKIANKLDHNFDRKHLVFPKKI